VRVAAIGKERRVIERREVAILVVPISVEKAVVSSVFVWRVVAIWIVSIIGGPVRLVIIAGANVGSNVGNRVRPARL